MWTRKELKAKGKTSFKNNYWRTVLVAILAMTIAGGGVAGAAGSGGARVNINGQPKQQDTSWLGGEPSSEETEDLEELLEQVESSTPDPDVTSDGTESLDEIMPMVELTPEGGHFEISAGEIAVILAIIGVFVLIVLVVAFAVSAFLLNPLSVGVTRFFTNNLNRKAEIKEVTYAFDHNYLGVVKTMFWRDLYTLLWGLLLIIPGIVKAYEYRMIPYLLAEDPNMSKDEAFAQSKALMNGNKWRAFVLDLSFLGWKLLSVLTLGIVAVFYAAPYQCMTEAALYERLRYGGDAPAGDAPQLTATAGPDDEIPVAPYAAADAPVPAWDEEPDATAQGSVADGPVYPIQPEE